MLFSLTPKRSREDLFDREEEFSLLKEFSKDGKVIVVEGMRRIGKTSLILSFLNEVEKESKVLMIDCRKYSTGTEVDYKGLISDIERKLRGVVGKFLSGVSKVSVDRIEIDISGSEEPLYRILERAGKRFKKKIFIALDEVQVLKHHPFGSRLLNLIAYAYDNIKNVVFILSGSEVGVLHDFLRLDDPTSPLFGRFVARVSVERFDRETSMEFLKKGFSEVEMQVDDHQIQRAVGILDGIVGYLSIFGYLSVKLGDLSKALDETVKMAKELVRKEIKELEKRSKNYTAALKAVAAGMKNFSSIKAFMKATGRNVSDQTVSNVLKNLQKMGFIEAELENGRKVYKIPDPMIREALR